MREKHWLALAVLEGASEFALFEGAHEFAFPSKGDGFEHVLMARLIVCCTNRSNVCVRLNHACMPCCIHVSGFFKYTEPTFLTQPACFLSNRDLYFKQRRPKEQEIG